MPARPVRRAGTGGVLEQVLAVHGVFGDCLRGAPLSGRGLSGSHIAGGHGHGTYCSYYHGHVVPGKPRYGVRVGATGAAIGDPARWHISPRAIGSAAPPLRIRKLRERSEA